MKFIALRAVAPFAVAAFLAGCSGGEGTGADGPKPVIDPSSAPAPTTSTSAANGIPSSGGATKRKPDPVGATSPIIPK